MVSAKELISVLKADGWSLDQEGIENLLEGSNFNIQQATNEVLNSDLKDVGAGSLSEDLLKGKKNSLSVPLVLQVAKMRNVSAPKAFEESGGAPRMLRVSLTDGSNIVQGLEVQNIKTLSLKTAPGTKVRLNGKVPVSGGFLLLTPNNISVIGGTVQELYEKWKLSASVSKYSRGVCAADGSGPPPWVPFGKRIVKNPTEMQKFKSLKDPEGKEKTDGEFENQRKQVVKELSKEGNIKVFGGGKQMLDANVQKVVNAGFSLDVAEWALRNSKNDPVKAIRELRAAATGQPSPPERNNYWEESEERSAGGRRGRGGRGRGKGKGRGGGGPDDSDDDVEPPPNMPRPSGPASLFDFFDTKMIEKKETVSFVEPVADVRGPAYNQPGRGSDRRGRGMGYQRGRGNRGGYSNRGTVNGSVTPPDMTTGNWPAPGEERAPLSTRSYLESKEMMEEKEKQDNSRKPPVRTGSGSARGYYSNYNQEKGQSYGREDGRQKGDGYYARDSDYRDGGARGNRDYYTQERGGRRGRSGGNYRGSGRGNNYTSGGSYGAGESGISGNYSEDCRGGRGNNSNNPRGNSVNYSNYRDANYSGANDSRSSSYQGNGSSYSDNRNRGDNNAYYGGRHDHYSSRQGSYCNDNSYSGGRGGNWNSGRGGRSTEYSAKELEMIQDFQHSMTLSGHYQQGYDKVTNYGRNEGGNDYSNFVGTLEFHRGGRGGGRRGRGNYY